MRILLTNDDGLDAEGLRALAEGLSPEHDVLVLAPDRERSGVSQGISLFGALKLRQVRPKEYACSGTPADCVLLALLGAVGFEPELVISGINRGPNLGTDILYSGTCAAAREAVLGGVPGIAVSCAARGEGLRFGAVLRFVRENLRALMESCGEESFVNVNAPSSDETSLPAVWSAPCRRKYGNALRSFEGPDGFSYHFLMSGETSARMRSFDDFAVVEEGKISVSQILVQPQLPSGFRSGREFR